MPEIERNLGEQPIARLLAELGLRAPDLVALSPSHLTHKMIARACKGRWLTRNTQDKVLEALNLATQPRSYTRADLFNY